jgi:hypothetical protein
MANQIIAEPPHILDSPDKQTAPTIVAQRLVLVNQAASPTDQIIAVPPHVRDSRAHNRTAPKIAVRPLVQASRAVNPTDQIIAAQLRVLDSRTILNNRTMPDVPALRKIIAMSRVQVARTMVGQITAVQTTMLPVPGQMKMLLAPELLIIGLERRKIATCLQQTITMFLVRRLPTSRLRSSSLGSIRVLGLRTTVLRSNRR